MKNTALAVRAAGTCRSSASASMVGVCGVATRSLINGASASAAGSRAAATWRLAA